jgi:hypothetical protein
VDCYEPIPFRFSHWKHHLNWVCSELEYLKNNAENEVARDLFFTSVEILNSNYIDIYTGSLSPNEILESIEIELNGKELLNKTAYSNWVGTDGYKVLKLKDGSEWILREGISEEYYIHIHPARFTPHSIRLHGNSYKTALILYVLYERPWEFDLSVINPIRLKYLKLSPLKRIDKEDKISIAIKVIETGMSRIKYD